MNKKLLREVMDKHNDTNNKLAAYLGIHPKTLYFKYSGVGDRGHFTLKEVKLIMERYSLAPEEVIQIFLS